MRRSRWHDHLFLKFTAFCAAVALMGMVPSLEKPSLFILQGISGLIGMTIVVGGALALPLLIYSFLTPNR